MLGGHIAAYLTACILDILIGDPQGYPHPVRLMGRLIAALDKRLGPKGDEAMASENRKKAVLPEHSTDTYTPERAMRIKGLILWIITELVTVGTVMLLMAVAYHIGTLCGIIIEAVLTYYIFAARSLYDESMLVYRELVRDGDELSSAREALSMIVGRDTQALGRDEIIKATVETIAENTSDGVIAPMLYAAIGGPALGYMYKAANTMDSMIGYRSARYRDLGHFAARADDVLSFLPARLSAVLMIAAAWIYGGGAAAKEAAHIYHRDRNKTDSPNAGQCESAMAGAIGLKLGGNAVYGGETVHKASLGEYRFSQYEGAIPDADRLMLLTALIAGAIAVAVMSIIYYGIGA